MHQQRSKLRCEFSNECSEHCLLEHRESSSRHHDDGDHIVAVVSGLFLDFAFFDSDRLRLRKTRTADVIAVAFRFGRCGDTAI